MRHIEFDVVFVFEKNKTYVVVKRWCNHRRHQQKSEKRKRMEKREKNTVQILEINNAKLKSWNTNVLSFKVLWVGRRMNLYITRDTTTIFIQNTKNNNKNSETREKNESHHGQGPMQTGYWSFSEQHFEYFESLVVWNCN